MNKSLLIAEDDDINRGLLRKVFSRPDLVTHEAKNGREAIDVLDKHPVDVILTDIRMPVADGLQVLSYARAMANPPEVILMTSYGSVESAVQAMQMGAFHYITKPFDVAEVIHLVDRVLEITTVRKENIHLKSQARNRNDLEHIIGTSDSIQHAISLVKKVADTDSTVLLLGESGTGKELFARAIHYLSPRVDQMLVPINCSAIPQELLESELFGHVKGAFTGAHQARAGRFEMANHGTIFLDEIGEMSSNLQAKLLRVLQEKSFIPVGGSKTVRVDVRVIAATHQDLEGEVQEGRFRADLFFRLNVIPIRIPALRERIDDIAILAHHFLEKFNREKSRSVEGILPETIEILKNYPWPGNVRELENVIERSVVLKGTGSIAPDDLPDKMRLGSASLLPTAPVLGDGGIDLRKAIEEFENSLIRQALEKARGNKNRAASLLGLKRTTFVEMTKRKNLDAPESSIF